MRPSVCARIIALFGSEGFDSWSTYRGAESLTGYEILTAAVMKSSVFWGMNLRSPDCATL
jgi:hypothetical protein